jgi:hypothetical protein
MQVINFTHGILFALGAYFAFSMQRAVGFWMALILAPLLVGLRYQRTCGSRHITVESGSLRAYPSDSDPQATKLEMVGWLAADKQDSDVVGGTLKDWFANLGATLATLPP